MKKWVFLLAVFFAWITTGFILTGPAGGRIRAVSSGNDNSGNKVVHIPGRIIPLTPAITETVFELGLGGKVVAVTSQSDWPENLSSLPSVGSFWGVDIESVIAARPHLVITETFPQQASVARRLRRMGYSVLEVDLEYLDQLFDAIIKIGRATGTTQDAYRLSGRIKNDLAAIRSAAPAETQDHPRILWVVQRQPLRAAGTETFINELIAIAGGQNAIGRTIHKYPPLGTEQVIAADPDIIIEPAPSDSDMRTQQKQALDFYRTRFAAVGAVKNNRIYVIEPSVVSRPGPRVCQAAKIISDLLWNLPKTPADQHRQP